MNEEMIKEFKKMITETESLQRIKQDYVNLAQQASTLADSIDSVSRDLRKLAKAIDPYQKVSTTNGSRQFTGKIADKRKRILQYLENGNHINAYNFAKIFPDISSNNFYEWLPKQDQVIETLIDGKRSFIWNSEKFPTMISATK